MVPETESIAAARARAARPAPSAETVKRLKNHIGVLSTTALKYLDQQLPWYRSLEPNERAALGLIAQKGISTFVTWYEDPSSIPSWVVTDVFGAAPTELTRSISLQKALGLLRTIVEVVESQVPDIAPEAEQAALREAVLRYSREVAFAAADVYARAAETRGAWDSRLEAHVVDAVMHGEGHDSLSSRLAAIGWKSQSNIRILVGATPGSNSVSFVSAIRRLATRYARDSLVSVLGDRSVLMLSDTKFEEADLGRLARFFGPGPLVYSPLAATVTDMPQAAQAAITGYAAACAWPQAPNPVGADDLWPERAFNGDPLARTALLERIYRPLQQASNGLLETLSSYLALGHSLEGTARGLFVHANTVRYRLKRVSEVTGWDPLSPRDAFVLQSALVVGRLADSGQ
ncbi:PucR family transcriptional regulator [Glutamicibacter protophormiae]|uniref:PucR family transcriptional regulator n=1 Tax=Glutamicibacter protophormiae TaxID=37930 RepID=UPI001956D521|nr:helix-turn-helix domain-containing protein [Glutamicibacter protophormiae]QRQ80093.1 helix-turn-helix domain-containing protein [Glutamicibacter protophormiae]